MVRVTDAGGEGLRPDMMRDSPDSKSRQTHGNGMVGRAAFVGVEHHAQGHAVTECDDVTL